MAPHERLPNREAQSAIQNHSGEVLWPLERHAAKKMAHHSRSAQNARSRKVSLYGKQEG